MDVLILTVREQLGCDQILQMTVNGDETYLKDMAQSLEAEALDWVVMPTANAMWIAYTTDSPKTVYTITEYEAIDLTP